MKKNYGYQKIIRAFLVACLLVQSAPAQAYSFQDFKTAFQKTYPTFDTPLKDLKVFWSYGIKKLTFQKISKKESEVFWLAAKRTGIPLAVILSIISAGLYKITQKPPSQEQLKSLELIAILSPFRFDVEKAEKLIDNNIGILHKSEFVGNPLQALTHLAKINAYRTPELVYIDHFIDADILNRLIKKVISKAKQYLASADFIQYINNKSKITSTPLLTLTFGTTTHPKHLELMELLLRNGANPNIVENTGIDSGFNTLDRYLQLEKRREVLHPPFNKINAKPFIKLLLQYGAKPTQEPEEYLKKTFEEAQEEVKKERFLNKSHQL